MKAVDLREMTNEELAVAYDEAGKELFNLRMQQTLGQLEKSSRIKEVRRNIARITMVKTERTKQVESAS